MQPAPTKKYPHGTWEFAASSVFWDAHYQAGLFFLSYAIAVRVNSSGAEQRRYALPALRQVSQDFGGCTSGSTARVIGSAIRVDSRFLPA